MVIPKNIFYSVKKILSRNCFINIIVGGRGTGKTFNCKKHCIEDFLKHGRQFFYVRRYNTELDLAMQGFFDQLQKEGYFTEHTFKIVKSKHLYKFFMDKQLIGFACALSTALIFKSASFPDVYNLIFDEALIARGSSYRYLKNETTQFLELLESIFRLRNGRVMILSNAITVANPYFELWGIIPKENKQFEIYHNGDVCFEQVQNEAFKQEKLKSPIGRLIANTAYGDYAIDNKMLQDDNSFIDFKPNDAKYSFLVKIGDSRFGVWTSNKKGALYVSSLYDPLKPLVIAFDAESHDESSLLVGPREGAYMRLRRAFEMGLLFFENQKQKHKVISALIRKYY